MKPQMMQQRGDLKVIDYKEPQLLWYCVIVDGVKAIVAGHICCCDINPQNVTLLKEYSLDFLGNKVIFHLPIVKRGTPYYLFPNQLDSTELASDQVSQNQWKQMIWLSSVSEVMVKYTIPAFPK